MKYKNKLFVGILGLSLAFVLASCDSGSRSGANNNSNIVPAFCMQNQDSFTQVNTLYPFIGTPTGESWGPNLANLPFPSNLSICKNYLTWNQGRVLAATLHWVSQKVNYCHHHVPTWMPTDKDAYNACESSVNELSSPAGIIRWNYSGVSPESNNDWYILDNAKGYGVGNYGYGLDCSDYSKLIYAYAESINFTSAVALQAGQSTAESGFAPNMPGFRDDTDPDINGDAAAGQLVCADGTVAPRGTITTVTMNGCTGHGGFISVFATNGSYVSNGITDNMLNNLQPGDLLYVAGCGSDESAAQDKDCNYNPSQAVTHVVIWTGEKVGLSSWITNSMLAPETDKDVYGSKHQQCAGQWWSAANNMGNWIITDSHYQGPDYRAFTNCFYRNQIWGVRRVLVAS